MDSWINVAMKVDPELANKIQKEDSVELVTRLADGKFDAMTKVAVKKDPKNKSVYSSLKRKKNLPLTATMAIGALKATAILGVAKGITGMITSLFMLPNMKMLIAKLDEISKEVNSVKKLSYLSTGIGLVNLGVEVAGFVYIGRRLQDVQKDIEQLSRNIGQIKSILTNEKISDYQKLCLRFGAISNRLADKDRVDRNEIEELIIDMRTFVSQMVRNFYYDAMDVDIILEVVFNLLTAYTALLNIYVRDYYFEKGHMPENNESYSSLFSELCDEGFSKLVEDYLILKKGFTIKEAINAIQLQKLLVANCMLQHKDQIDILKIVETRDNYLSLIKITDSFIMNEVDRVAPEVTEETGRKDCKDIIRNGFTAQFAI